MTDKNIESIQHILESMNEEDLHLFIKSIDEDDFETTMQLSKKYGYMYLPKLEISDKKASEIVNGDINTISKNYERIKEYTTYSDDSLERLFDDKYSKLEIAKNINELIELDKKINTPSKATKIIDAMLSEKIRNLTIAVEVLYKSGCTITAKNTFKLLMSEYNSLLLSNVDKQVNERLTASERARNNGLQKEHKDKQQIIEIINKTWSKYPAMSQNNMITEIMKTYNVSRSALLNWIKDNKLKPPAPEKYASGKLVKD